MQPFYAKALRSVSRCWSSSELLVLILLLFSCAAQAQDPVPAPAKRVSLQFVNASLKTVIREIEKQTKYTFAIATDELETRRGVSIHVHNTPLVTVLRTLFPPARYTTEVRDGQIIVIPLNDAGLPIHPPTIRTTDRPGGWTISGVVTDGATPLSGVSIREKGTQHGTATAEDGTFQLTTSPQAMLQISLIGFESREISVRDRRNVSIILQPDLKKLNELVVLGYGLQRRANITGAIAQIDGVRLKSRPVPNVMAALQGTATGLIVTRSNGQPGKEGFNVQVRGVPSASNNNTPVIVDGVPGSLAVLNPDDIESVSILKDAAAAAIYGARGAGGVVLVTTRSGKPGKLTVELSTLAGTETPIRLPDRLPSWQEATMLNTAAQNSGLPPYWQPHEIGWMQSGMNRYAVDADHPDYYKYYYNFNQLPLLTKSRTGIQTYNLSFKGGGTRHQFSASVGYFGRQGLFAAGPDNTHRINTRFNLNSRFSKHISLETRFSYAQSNIFSPGLPVEGPGGLLTGLYRGPSNFPVYVPGTEHYAFGGPATYAQLKDGGERDEKNNYFDAVITLRADSLVKGLTLRLIYSPQQHQYYDYLALRPVPLWNRYHPVSYTQPYAILQKNKLLGQGHNVQFLTDYDIKKGKHNFHLLGGATVETYNTEQRTGVAQQVSNDELDRKQFHSNTPVLDMQQYNKGSLLSFFGKFSYNYDNRYLLEANLIGARLHQLSGLFPEIQQWQAFPSFSAGWRLNNETWFNQALPFFNEFKLRWSWGRLGNINSWNQVSNDERYQIFTFNPSRYSPFYYHNPVPMPYGWENIATTNFGWDATLFRGKLTLSADYFIKRNHDMRMPVLTASTEGAWPVTYNNGEMKSWGWELNIGWRNSKGPLQYWINANLFNNQTKVLRNNGVAPQPGWNQGITGYPYSSLFGYKASGYFQTAAEVQQHAYQGPVTAPGDLRYEDINGDNIIDRKDLVYLGSTDPRFSYGIDAGFSYKGLDFSVFFQGVGKREVMPDPRYSVPFQTPWQQAWDINRDYWRPDNPNALFPRLYVNDQHNTVPGSHWVMNGSYIRLKNVQLGYTLPAALFRRTPVTSIRVYFSGQDLWETNNLKIRYYDPEQASGYNGNVYPFFRSYTLGLNAVF